MSVLQLGSPSQALARGIRFYLARIFRRPYPYLVLAYALFVPSAMALLGTVDLTQGWTRVVIGSFPVVYLAPVVAAGLGGKIGFEDGPGFRAGLPALGLSVNRQYQAAATALALASLTVIGGGLGVSGILVRLVLGPSMSGSFVEGIEGVSGFAVIALGLVVLVYTYAVIEFVGGRLFEMPGRTIGWLMGINTASAFTPIGIEMFGARAGSLADHITLWTICISVLISAFLLGKRLET